MTRSAEQGTKGCSREQVREAIAGNAACLLRTAFYHEPPGRVLTYHPRTLSTSSALRELEYLLGAC